MKLLIENSHHQSRNINCFTLILQSLLTKPFLLTEKRWMGVSDVSSDNADSHATGFHATAQRRRRNLPSEAGKAS